MIQINNDGIPVGVPLPQNIDEFRTSVDAYHATTGCFKKLSYSSSRTTSFQNSQTAQALYVVMRLQVAYPANFRLNNVGTIKSVLLLWIAQRHSLFPRR